MSPNRRTPLLSLAASALFFVSGGTALAYQVIWFKRFAHLWGSSSLAMAGVVAGFLLGLGLGARVLGAWADRVRSPLRVYGLCELGIALLALAVPHELEALQGATASFYGWLQPHPLLHTLVRFLAAFLVLGPPCMLMGATLPLLVRQFVVSSGGLARATGWFYAINTAGAAAGCYLTGFHLLPIFGLAATHVGAVALNALVGTTAIVLGRPSGEGVVADAGGGGAGAPLDLPFGVRLAALTTGAAALMLQMVWMRQLALLLGGTTYAFTAVVLVVLVGIGLGSLLLRLFFDARGPGLRLFTAVAVALVLTALAGQLALPSLAEHAGAVRQRRIDPGFNALLCVGTSVALELLPSLAAGVLFPLLVHFTGARHGAAGRAVGRVYAWNTAGTTLGGVLPNLILFPLVGTRATGALALGLYLVAPLLLAGFGALRARLFGFGAWILAWIAVPLVLSRPTPELQWGLYIYGPEALPVLRARATLFHSEGSSCDVTVTEYEGNRSLQVNGKTDASTHAGDQSTQLGTGYLPRLLRPDARELCVIGYGSGATVGASLLFPMTERLDCLEIENGVFAASEYFESINHRPGSFPAFHAIVDDGRSHVQATSRTYDLILTEPSNPWMAGISNLFTREFYESARDRLRSGGLLAQWIQTYALSFAEYEMIVRTMTEVFPNCGVLWLDEGNTMILASFAPILPAPEALDRVQAAIDGNETIRADLSTYFQLTDARSLLLQHMFLGEEDVVAWMEAAPDARLNTDWNMRLEFDAPLHLFAYDERSPGHRLSSEVMTRSGEAFQRRLFDAIGGGPGQADGLASRTRVLAYFGRNDLAAAAVHRGLELAPEHAGLLGAVLRHDPPADPEGFRSAAAALVRADPQEANAVALAMAEAGDLERATELMRTLAGSVDDAAVWFNLGAFLEYAGRTEEARDATRRSLALDSAAAQTRELAARLGVPLPPAEDDGGGG